MGSGLACRMFAGDVEKVSGLAWLGLANVFLPWHGR